MIVFLFNIIFSTITALSNVVSFLLLRAASYLALVDIQAFKVPGGAAESLLQQVAEAIRSIILYLVELLIDAVMSLLSSAFDLLVEAISGSVSLSSSAVGEFIGMAKTGLDYLPKMLLEVLGEASQMVGTIISDVWENSKDAIGYIMEKT